MSFNYNKLRGRIVEMYRTNKAFADAVGTSDVVLSRKLNGASDFTHSEMKRWQKLLDISDEDMGAYFFTEDVKKTEQEAV